MYYTPGIWFYIAATISLMLMGLGLYSRVHIWRQGKNPGPKRLQLARLPRALLRQVFVQPGLRELSILRWTIHMAIFVGFAGLFVQTSFLFLIDDFLSADSALVSFFYHGAGQALLDIWGDLFGLLLLTGLVAALARRLFGSDPRIEGSEQDIPTLLLLLLISLSGFMLEGLRINLDPGRGSGFSYIGLISAHTLAPLAGALFYKLILWLHIALSLFFIAYLPFSKLLHILTAPLLAAFEEASKP